MADYKPPQYRPSLYDLRRGYSDQGESNKFTDRARKIILEINMDEETVIMNCYGFLYQRDGIVELTEFMSYVKDHFGIIDNSKSQSKTYEFVKAIPALSNEKIGYTFRKKGGGLFFFLMFD
jgi:hypothetical protein